MLYARWSHQLQRWSDYRSLAGLLAFIAVFLGVLYAQRGATTAYQVHSTIAAVVLPPADSLSSTQDVYAWLAGLLTVRGRRPGWARETLRSSATCIVHAHAPTRCYCRWPMRATVSPLQAVWVDPTCGDGSCEAPFEFAAFSRFGCKADCGRLADIQNLTSAQVDVYWDFSHQAASLPAAVRAARTGARSGGSRRRPCAC